MLLSIAVLVVPLAAGCGCLSSQQVSAKERELRSRNHARVESGMLAAAQRQGAILLSIEPQSIAHRLPCVEGTDEATPVPEEALHNICLWTQSQIPGCQQGARDGRSFLIRNRGERPKLVIPIREVDGAAYARLARRGNELIVLLPRLTSQRQVGTVTECECDGMPRVQCQSTFGFVVDDVPAGLEIVEDRVPMIEDYLWRICKTTAV